MSSIYDHFAVGLDQVKGWFKDTPPSAEISQLAIIRLDGDYYESTHDALMHLYPSYRPVAM